jgi:antibiotic biosynthesis monooxygenase (ABM) superfamily enzyme
MAPLLGLLLGSWPQPLRLVINTGITVMILTYWLMPLLTRRFKGWLFKA